MLNERNGTIVPDVEAQYLNEDNSRATWVTRFTLEQRLRKAAKPTLIGGALTVLIWGLQFSAGTLAEHNWGFALWPFGIGLVFAFFAITTTETRHYSTKYIAYTKKQRLSRAWKWWAIPLAMFIALFVLNYSLDTLADKWGEVMYVLIFTIPGFGLYMLKGEDVLTPAAAKTKSLIDNAMAQKAKLGTGEKSRWDIFSETLLNNVWVRYGLAIGCFWICYWLFNQKYKSELERFAVVLLPLGYGIYFAREVSKWLFGAAFVGLIGWAIVAGFSALSIPAAIIIGALIIAGSVKK